MNALNSARISPEQHYHKAPCQEWPSLTLGHLIKLLKKAVHELNAIYLRHTNVCMQSACYAVITLGEKSHAGNES